jgi:hypothetical protein
MALSRPPLVGSCKELQLFAEVDFGELQSRTEDIYSMMNRARRIIKLYYQDLRKLECSAYLPCHFIFCAVRNQIC